MGLRIVMHSELLAPAGNMEALKAAVANGADAVYLGMTKFGARAYSNNFDEEALAEAVAYAHLRDVKVYVTVNTIVFEDELPQVYAQLDYLNQIGVDGVIVQDLAVLEYVASHFEDMEAHCSTQMGLSDLEGAQLAKELGAKRVVLAREVPVDEVKRIRREADIPVEIFVHGALCISYSGNCIMSGMTGNRSGNRGRCIGSCRKLYAIQDLTTGEVLGENYILSAKDLSTIDYVDQLDGIDSLKIEGRMKEPVYVANVVSRYRKALDGAATTEDVDKLSRTFNRTFTKGYLFGEDRYDITNVARPNHHGYRIGVVAGMKRGMYRIELDEPLAQNDVIRIQHGDEDVNLAVAKLYDADGRFINGSEDVCFIKVKEKLSAGDAIFKMKDVAYERQLESMLEGEYRRFPLNMDVYAYPGAPLSIDAKCGDLAFTYEGEEPLSEAKSKPATKESVIKQLAKLNDTVFKLGEVSYEDNGAFLPVSVLNEARRSIVEAMGRLKVNAKPRRMLESQAKKPLSFVPQKPHLTAAVVTEEQYQACLAAGISAEDVYFENVVPRNGATYEDREGELLVGGMGGIQRYRETNPFVTDYSLNVVNASTVAQLHKLGAKRVTLSYEINQDQLRDLLASYQEQNGGAPALEMIVYGHAPLLVTKYCPLKKMDQCGRCQTHRYQIEEEHGTFPIMVSQNCNATVLNGKVLNLLDEMSGIQGVEAFRLNFTIESAEEIAAVVAKAQAKLDGTMVESAFGSATDTRGYFYKEIL